MLEQSAHDPCLRNVGCIFTRNHTGHCSTFSPSSVPVPRPSEPLPTVSQHERANAFAEILHELIRPDNGKCNQCGAEWFYRLDGSWEYLDGEHFPHCIARRVIERRTGEIRLSAFVAELHANAPAASSEEAANSDTPDGISLIAAERKRQVEVRNWTASHDDDHRSGELAKVAAAVAVHHTDATVSDPGMELDDPWGILSKHDNSRNPIRCLTIAGALIAAEIDRLNRAAARVQGERCQR